MALTDSTFLGNSLTQSKLRQNLRARGGTTMWPGCINPPRSCVSRRLAIEAGNATGWQLATVSCKRLSVTRVSYDCAMAFCFRRL